MAYQNLIQVIDGTLTTISTVTRSDGGGSPSNIWDGDEGTFDTISVNTQFWTVDLGFIKNICKILLYLTDNTDGSNFYIDISSDGITYERCVFCQPTYGSSSTRTYSTGWNTFYINPVKSGRYIKIINDQIGLSSDLILNEVNVYTTLAPFIEFTMLGTDSDYNEGATTTDNARRRHTVDDYFGSNAQMSLGTYLQYDLLENRFISKISYREGGAGTPKSDFQISINGTDWTSVLIHTSTSTDWQENEITPVEARYVRWYCHATSGVFLVPTGLRLYENVEIFDIPNDLRTLKLWARVDFNQDFRMKGVLVRSDINNDFRMTGANLNDINNDFRMIIPVYGLYDVNCYFNMVELERYDINNKINFVISEVYNINNDFRTSILVESDIKNKCVFALGELKNINNDIRTLKLNKQDINNDIRFILPWQKAGDVGFQSRGKEYIKIYINGIENTSVDVDSISINKQLNAPSTCSFDIAVAFDSTPPTKKQKVIVKYDNYVLYTGYISDTEPSSNPENIKINCKDKYWYNNQYEDKLFFFVGHPSTDSKETYYSTISSGLSAAGYTGTNVGSFTPEQISCFGVPKSDAISNLITQSGNYGWYYDSNENQRLWTSGSGNIIDLEPQTIGTNLGLYQVLNHNIKTSVENLVNEYRVQMGQKVVRTFYSTNSSGEPRQYSTYRKIRYSGTAIPAWESQYEIHADGITNGFGWNNPPLNEEYKYNDVYTRYTLPTLADNEGWTDEHPPVVLIHRSSSSHIAGIPTTVAGVDILTSSVIQLNSGFTIDYDKNELLFNERIYEYDNGEDDAPSDFRAPRIELYLWKKQYYSWTDKLTYPTEDPTRDISNPMMFFTGKMGDYADTIQEAISYTGYSMQTGGTYQDSNGNSIIVPSWNDTDFAKDVANWNLSQRCDVKEYGTLAITIDAMMFYNIELNNRINVDGITTQALNIESIDISVRDFVANINLKNGRTYGRTVSIPYHGT